MGAVSSGDLRLLSGLSRLTYTNPFSRERIAEERDVLGMSFVPDDSIAWSRSLRARSPDRNRPNVLLVFQLASELIEKLHERSRWQTESTLQQYWDVMGYVLLYKHIVCHKPSELLAVEGATIAWRAFKKDFRRLAKVEGLTSVIDQSAEHLFACLCQAHRAFIAIYDNILGDSRPSVDLRRNVWESIFTKDMRRYCRTLFQTMGRLPTLVSGPSGTGKELVARAVGLSQYIPFDGKTGCFAKSDEDLFLPLNLAAMSQSLIESELFGHKKGAFTGAFEQRVGWLEKCERHGTIFLDEIGETDAVLQVKLLRVVQQRTFSRVGETRERRFTGKLIAATNRDLAQEINAGRFRTDLYYRLCSDRIETPSLREQLLDCPGDLEALCFYIAKRLADRDAEAVAQEAADWINEHLGRSYPWHGNIRELEQCVSSILIRGSYVSAHKDSSMKFSRAYQDSPKTAWLYEIESGEIDCDRLQQLYCTWVYFLKGSYEAAARQLGIDRRTVKARVDQDLLRKMKE